jgi:cytochrome c oxidase subunit 4
MEMLDSFKPHLHQPGDPIAPAKTWWIWKVFWILLAVTSVEVGIAYANYALEWGMKQQLKYLYIFLTLVKAAYIIFSYMHLKDEKKTFQFTLGTLVVILTYFIVLMMIEGYYQEDVRLVFPDYMTGHGPGGH